MLRTQLCPPLLLFLGIIFIVWGHSIQVTAQQLQVLRPKGQIRNVVFLREASQLPKRYPFIQYARNKVDFGTNPSPFLEALSRADSETVSIVHLGDSHIQADVLTGTLRGRLQTFFGNGGRGFIFPYRVAKSNNPDDYTTSSTGLWSATKNTLPAHVEPLGVSGFAVSTTDEDATVTVKFRNASLQPLGNQLTVWAQTGAIHYEPRVALQDSVPVYLQPDTLLSDSGYWVFTLPRPITQGFILKLNRVEATQNRFVLNGFELENVDSSGIVYHSAGVNGAKILDYLRSPSLGAHLQHLEPDLVVLDVGVNDYYASPNLPIYVQDSLERLVNKVRVALPNVEVILCSQQPNLRRKRSVRGAKQYAEVIKAVAKKFAGVYVYDFFAPTDTKRSAQRWRAAGLMTKDGIHLTRDGYRYKGLLFTQAILDAYREHLVGKGSN